MLNFPKDFGTLTSTIFCSNISCGGVIQCRKSNLDTHTVLLYFEAISSRRVIQYLKRYYFILVVPIYRFFLQHPVLQYSRFKSRFQQIKLLYAWNCLINSVFVYPCHADPGSIPILSLGQSRLLLSALSNAYGITGSLYRKYMYYEPWLKLLSFSFSSV